MSRTVKRDEVWQRKVADRESSALKTWILSLSEGERTASLHQAVRRHQRDSSYLSQLKVVLNVTELIRHHAHQRSSDRKTIEGLKALGERVLLAHQVRPQKSRLAFLYAELQGAMAAWDASRGRNISWRWQLARDLTGLDTAPFDTIESARHALRWGDTPEALRLLEGSEVSTESLHLKISCFRLAGDVFRALAILDEAMARFPEQKGIWLGVARLCDAQLSGSPAGLFDKAIPVSLRQQAELALWCLASMNREWLDRRPTAASLRKSVGPHAPASTTVLIDAIEIFEQAYDSSLPLINRLERVGGILSAGEALAEVEQELLVVAAAARWLRRIRRRALCSQALARYRSLSLSLSGGATADSLGVLTDIFEERESSYQKTIQTGYFGRSLAFGSLSLEIMAALGRRRLSQLFGADKQSARLKESEASVVTSIATRYLSELKGPLMKVGQTASYFGLELPPLSVEILSSLQDNSQPLNPEKIRQILEIELGARLESRFSRFDDEPIGVGSIGQVHAAQLPCGREVAVKVRYPGIEQAIESDLFLLRILLPVIRLLNAQSIPQETLDELRDRLLEECDYRREARHQQAFRLKFGTVGEIYVPEVFESHCSDGVLTTELVHGMTLAEFKRVSTKAERARMGDRIMEYVLGSCRDGMFNADPHPGNFLFRRDKLIAIDFGSVKLWQTEEAEHWADLCRAGVLKDYELFKRSIQKMGIVGNPRNFDFRAYFDIFMGGCMGETAIPAERQFDRRKLRQELNSLFGNANPNQRHTYYNPSYLYGIRVYSGLISLLAELEAECNYHVSCGAILGVESKMLPPFGPSQEWHRPSHLR